jgi:hypothetical protein
MKLTLIRYEIHQSAGAPEDPMARCEVPNLSFTFKAPLDRTAFVARTITPGMDAFEVANLLRKLAQQIEHMACAKETR